MFTLAKKQQIGGYIIAFPIREGDYAETYRVKDSDGKNRFLKLINYAKLHRTQFDVEGRVLEVEIAKNSTILTSPGILIAVMSFSKGLNSFTLFRLHKRGNCRSVYGS